MSPLLVVVKVSKEVAPALHRPQEPRGAHAEQPASVVEALGLSLEPMHPATTDQNLMSYFVVEVPDAATARAVIDGLQPLGAVEAAYLKPPDEQP